MDAKTHQATHQADLGKQLADAVTRVGLEAGLNDSQVNSECESVAFTSTQAAEKPAGSEQKPWNPRNGQKKPAVSPLSGAPTPPGRPAGVKNKLTDLRAAVLEAFDRVGGAEYLVRLAEGTQSDRAAFVSLMNKVLPTQVNQQVEGGVRLELSWLGGRNIGTTAAQLPDERKQVLDLERDSTGNYRIKDPTSPPMGVADVIAEGVPAGPAAGAGNTPSQKAAGDAQGSGT